MKNQALPNSHFCTKVSKVPNSPTPEANSAFLIADYVLEMSVKRKFQCVRFDKKHFLFWWF